MTPLTKKIVTIGGGSGRFSTLPIDKEIVKLANKKNPKFLFIPTASSDDQKYWNYMQELYGKKLKCKTDVLFLIKENPTSEQIKNKIQSADIIYVGGGNTLMMMKLWRKLKVDKLLKEAWQKGTVMCGLSAGSICWYEFGHSDSMSYFNPKRWKYIKVRGLGLLKGIHCPHFDSHTLKVPRKTHFIKMIKAHGGLGIAIDNDCAIEYIDNKFKIIPAKKNAGAHKIFKKNSKVFVEKIPTKNNLEFISKIL